MASDGECFYHILTLLTGKMPVELKRCVREVVNTHFDHDSEVQQWVQDAVRDEWRCGPSLDVCTSSSNVKATFLSQLNHAWGGAHIINLLTKHSNPVYHRCQLWSINWVRGGVVRLGMVPRARYHAFVSWDGNHYYLLSRIPTRSITTHPFVFENVDQKVACGFAAIFGKETTVKHQNDDEVIVINEES